ncbi:MAG TPA: DUF1579 domain-containing protein [Armatimonadota bacterium]|nr:DUF1579 domain-containing protein [Armatimonadota bacterium]
METGREGTQAVQEMMDVYKKLGTPGEPHKLLSRMEGSWETRTKAWVSPDQPPSESKGTAEHKMIFDGRYLQENMSGDMMGTPFTGIGYMGYDNNTGKYVTVWLDDMSTSIMYFEGTASPDGKTITQTSQYNDPIQGPMVYRAVTTFIDDNTFGFEMYGKDQTGKEDKMMETVYTRR